MLEPTVDRMLAINRPAVLAYPTSITVQVLKLLLTVVAALAQGLKLAQKEQVAITSMSHHVIRDCRRLQLALRQAQRAQRLLLKLISTEVAPVPSPVTSSTGWSLLHGPHRIIIFPERALASGHLHVAPPFLRTKYLQNNNIFQTPEDGTESNRTQMLHRYADQTL
jgi:hypothetical protein